MPLSNSDGVIKIGRNARTHSFFVGKGHPLRIVAPFGTSSSADLAQDQIVHIRALACAGADAIQELSTYGAYWEMRRDLCDASPVPYGTVLAYEVFDKCMREPSISATMLEKHLLETLEAQIDSGVDYITIHASLCHDLLNGSEPLLGKRAIPIPSRSAGMLMTLMRRSGSDNPLYVHFEKIARLAAHENVVVSLGASLRPAAIADVMDEAHQTEIRKQGEVVSIAKRFGTQVMLEGLSHGLPSDVARYIEFASEHCPGTPITALGPLPTDIAAGYDHVAAAIGITFGALAGLDLINVVSAKEHLAMPTIDDMIDAIRSAKLGIHVAQTILSGPTSPRDRSMSEARARLDWDAQAQYALFPDLFQQIKDTENLQQGSSCSICGRRCPFLVTSQAVW